MKSYDYNKIKITWKKAGNAKEYEVYRATSKNGKYKKVKTTSETNYINSCLTTGKKYYYKVRAVNGRKKGAYSSEKYATPILSTPKIVSKASGENDITLKFNKVNGAAKYQIYRATSKNGKFSKVGTVSSTSFYNKKLNRDKGYYYKVRAYRKVGSSYKYSKYSSVVYVKTKNHSYSEKYIEPICTENGYTVCECKYCGNSYKKTYVSALGHTWREIDIIEKYGDDCRCGGWHSEHINEAFCYWCGENLAMVDENGYGLIYKKTEKHCLACGQVQ